MDSMNAQELDGTSLNAQRVYRLAKGSGTSCEEVWILTDEFKKMSKIFGAMSKTNLAKAGNNMSSLQRNPQQMMSQLGKNLDPKLLQ